MKKNWFILIFLLSVFSFVLVLADQITVTEDVEKVFTQDKKDSFDFRKTKWGMNKAQVREIEKNILFQEEEWLLAYWGNAGGFDCLIVYIFAEGKLVRGRYIFTISHTNKNDYLIDYKKVKKILIKKYGKPIKDRYIWRNDLFRNNYQKRGLAISIGHLVYFAQWELPDTYISLILYGENFEISLELEYQSKKLEEIEQKIKEKEELDEF